MKSIIACFLMAFICISAAFVTPPPGFPVKCRYTKCPIGYYCKVVTSGESHYDQNFTECAKIINPNLNETFDPHDYNKVSCKGVDCPEDQKCAIVFEYGFRPHCYYKDDWIFQHHPTGLLINCKSHKCPNNEICSMVTEEGHSVPKCFPFLKKE